MKIFLSPVVSETNKGRISYEYGEDKITVKVDDVEDVFDFSGFPDGRVTGEDIRTDLEINPIISAERKDGELFVKLINFIGLDATEEERFPEWQEVGNDGGN